MLKKSIFDFYQSSGVLFLRAFTSKCNLISVNPADGIFISSLLIYNGPSSLTDILSVIQQIEKKEGITQVHHFEQFKNI